MPQPLTVGRQLRRLPKLVQPRSLKWGGVANGSVFQLLGYEPFNPADVVDPSHPFITPGVKSAKQLPRFPTYQDPSDAFGARLVPSGLLSRLAQGVDRSITAEGLQAHRKPTIARGRRARRERTDMAWLSVAGPATVHKSAVIRTKVSNKLKQAASLIVTRGAAPIILVDEPAASPGCDAKAQHKGKGKSKAARPLRFGEALQFNDEEVGAERWVMQGWTYVFWPKLPLLRMPYPNVIHGMRQALSQLKQEAEQVQKRIDHLRMEQAKAAEMKEARTAQASTASHAQRRLDSSSAPAELPSLPLGPKPTAASGLLAPSPSVVAQNSRASRDAFLHFVESLKNEPIPKPLSVNASTQDALAIDPDFSPAVGQPLSSPHKEARRTIKSGETRRPPRRSSDSDAAAELESLESTKGYPHSAATRALERPMDIRNPDSARRRHERAAESPLDRSSASPPPVAASQSIPVPPITPSRVDDPPLPKIQLFGHKPLVLSSQSKHKDEERIPKAFMEAVRAGRRPHSQD